jgi:hypothetical protein
VSIEINHLSQINVSPSMLDPTATMFQLNYAKNMTDFQCLTILFQQSQAPLNPEEEEERRTGKAWAMMTSPSM